MNTYLYIMELIFIKISGKLVRDNDTLPNEIFEKCSILIKTKEGENFNHRNTFSILRIKI